MTSASDKVEDAITDLISAKEKIKELEEDVNQLAQRSNRFEVEAAQLRERLDLNNEGMDEVKETLEQALEVAHSLAGRQATEIEYLKDKVAAGLAVNKSLVAEIRSISESRDMWKQSWDNAHKAFGALQDVVLGKGSTTETYDDLLAPVKELVNFKETVRSCLSMNYDSSCGKLAHELRRALNPGSTEERDSILSEIRKVLGAKDRNADRPHETALQAAKRVMEALKKSKETEKCLHDKIMAKDTSYQKLVEAAGYRWYDATEIVAASIKSDREKRLCAQDDLSELVALRKVADLARDVAGLVPGSDNGVLISHLKSLKPRQAFSSKQFGAKRTYTPPEGYVLIKQDLLKQIINETIQDTIKACGQQFVNQLFS